MTAPFITDGAAGEVPNATAIARIARGLDDADAGRLIQKYADTIAAIRTERAVSEAYRMVISSLEAPLSRKEPTDA